MADTANENTAQTQFDKARIWLNTFREQINALVPEDKKADFTLNPVPEGPLSDKTLAALMTEDLKAREVLNFISGTDPNNPLIAGFKENVAPLTNAILQQQQQQYAAAALETAKNEIKKHIATDTDSDTITINGTTGTFQIKWGHIRGGAMTPDIETGFSYGTADGKALETLGKEAAQQTQNTINEIVLFPPAQAAIIEETAKIIAHRLKNTDRNPGDKISPRDIREVRKGFLSAVGRVDPNNLMDIISIPAFYQAMEMIENDFDPDDFKSIMKGADADIKMSQEALDTFIKNNLPAAQAQQKQAPPQQQTTVKPAAPPAQTGGDSAPTTTKPATTAPAEKEEAEGEAETKDENQPLVFEDYISKAVRFATLELENTFAVNNGYRIKTHQESDQFLDPVTVGQIKDTIMDALARYGQEYYEGDTPKTIPGEDAKTRYSIDKNGNIHKIVDGKKQDTAVGHITDGLEFIMDDDTGKIVPNINPSDVTYKFLKDMRQNLFAQRNQLGASQISEQKAENKNKEEREKLLKKRAALLADYFGDDADAEKEFRKAFEAHTGKIDAFKNTEIAKKMRAQAADKGVFDTFIVAIFANRDGLNQLSSMEENFQQDADNISAIVHLFSALKGDGTFQGKMSELFDKAGAKPDTILSLNAYTFLEGHKSRKYIAVEELYDDGNEEQYNAVKIAFLDKGITEITRHELAVFVRRQVDLRAIKTLAPEIYEAAEKAGKLDTVEKQDAFIEKNHIVLRQVGDAISKGQFNPDERDIQITFKAFHKPSLQDPELRNHIERMLNTTENIRPTTHYMLCIMEDDELEDMTRERVDAFIRAGVIEALPEGTKFRSLPRVDQEKVLRGILAEPLWSDPNRAGYEAYQRLMMSYYESHLPGYLTARRNGNLNDTGMNTWNGRYGGMTPDQQLHMYMMNEWSTFKDIYGEEKYKRFFNKSGTRLNFNLTYEQAVVGLTDDQREALDGGIAEEKNASVYTYMVQRRGSEKYEDRSYYYELRRDRYVPNMLTLQLKDKFGPKAEGEGTGNNPTTNPDGNPDGPGQNGPVTNQDGTDQDIEVDLRQSIEDLLKDDDLPPAGAAGVAKLPLLARGIYGATKPFNKAGQIAQVVPASSAKHAAAAMKILSIADNAEVGSSKHIDALKRANGLMKEVGLTEAQIRLQGALNGTPLIPENKLDKAGRALKLLVAADNYPQYSPDIEKAHELAQKLMDKYGLSETQIRLLGLQKGTEILPEGKEKTANRALRALEIADNAQTATKRTQAMESAQRMMKAQGLTEAQVRAFGLAQQNPKAIKQLQAIPQQIAAQKTAQEAAEKAAEAKKPAQTETPERFKVENPDTKPGNITQKALNVTDAQREALEKIHILEQVRTSGKLNTSEKLRLQKMITGLKADHKITDGMIKDFAHRKPVVKDLPGIDDLADKIKGQNAVNITNLVSEYAQNANLYGDSVYKPAQRIPKEIKLTTKLDEIPKIKSSWLKHAAKSLVSTFTRVGKGGAAISKSVFGETVVGYLIGAGVGGIIATAEAGHLESKHDFLVAANLLSKDQQKSLKNIYKWAIGYAIGDPSTVFGEMDIKEKIAALGRLNPLVTEMVSPDQIIDIFSSDKLTNAELAEIKSQFTDEAELEKMYTSIAKAHGLPEKYIVEVGGKPQEVSIGVIMRRKKDGTMTDAAKEIWSKYVKKIPDSNDNSDNPEHITRYVVDENYKSTERKGLLYLETLNEMAATAAKMVEEYKRAQEILHAPLNNMPPPGGA
ncbi:MAG: hypothetical protein H6861_06020 [Rhodospirillales bacterium]|nr:hypothetical protein [Rhodospirillales bacterium]